MVGRKRKFYIGKFSGSSSIMYALKERLKVLDLECIPDEVIKEIVFQVKKAYESRSKEEIRKSFQFIKQELKKITQGFSDTDFFNIAKKYALPYVPKEFKLKTEKIKKK